MWSLVMIQGIGFAAAAVGPNVMYFRNHNMDRSSSLAISSDATSVTLNEWDTAINVFDSPNDVTVQRIDIKGSQGANISLYSKSSPLLLSEGPIYFFHNATQLQLTDDQGKSYSAKKDDAVVWISKGSCVQLTLTLSSAGEASLLAVTSGAVKWTGSSTGSKSCGATTVLIDGGPRSSSAIKKTFQFPPSGGFIYNKVKYTLTNSEQCATPLEHGENGYSQTDMPIGPLEAHYHTRGALYYNQYGTSKYNDEAAPNDTLYQGELRFVNTGIYYGPEELNQSTGFVASVHEADPSAIDPVDQHPTTECPFACKGRGKGTKATCIKSADILAV